MQSVVMRRIDSGGCHRFLFSMALWRNLEQLSLRHAESYALVKKEATGQVSSRLCNGES